MVKKDWEISLGERKVNTGDPDKLLQETVSERERRRIERQEELDDAKHEAQMAKLKKEEASAKAAVEKPGEKKEEGLGGFKITGGMNLGNIDYPGMLQKQIDERDELRRQAEEATSKQQTISDDLRERLHASEMKVLESSFNSQVQILSKMIEQNASKGNFAEQLNATMAIAKQLGFERGSPGGGSETLQLEIKRLEFEHDRAMREASRADKAEERRWQIELRRLDDERDAKRAELAQQQDKIKMFATAPRIFGDAMGRAIVDGGGGGSVTESPPVSRGKMQKIEAGVGEAGEAECVNCHQPVAVGPTARTAVCAGCGTRYSITRVETEITPPSSASQPIPGQEPAFGGEGDLED